MISRYETIFIKSINSKQSDFGRNYYKWVFQTKENKISLIISNYHTLTPWFQKSLYSDISKTTDFQNTVFMWI